MLPTKARRISAPSVPQIQCGSCQERLPLRLTQNDEPAAVWHCAQCGVPFVACCVKEALLESAHLIRLDERFFDISEQPKISLSDRQRAAKLASRAVSNGAKEMRRSERVSKSLVVPAIQLGPGLVPVGDPFPLMVSNLSREGVGLIHDERIVSEYIAIEFQPTSQSPIQVIVRIVRIREVSPPYFEIGGEFTVRLGSLLVH